MALAGSTKSAADALCDLPARAKHLIRQFSRQVTLFFQHGCIDDESQIMFSHFLITVPRSGSAILRWKNVLANDGTTECADQWHSVDLGLESCHELYKVDTKHLLTCSPDGMRVWSTCISECGVLSVIGCVAFANLPVSIYNGLPDASDPRRLCVQDASSFGVILTYDESNENGDTFVWKWKTNTFERCAISMPNVNIGRHSGVNMHGYPKQSCVVNFAKRCFIDNQQYVSSWNTYNAHDFTTHVHNVYIGKVSQTYDDFSSERGVTHTCRLRTHDTMYNRLPFVLTCTLLNKKHVRLLVELYRDSGFNVVDLDSGKMDTFNFHRDVFKVCVDNEGGGWLMSKESIVHTYEASNRWLLPADKESARKVHVVPLGELAPKHVFKFCPDVVTCLPAALHVSSPNVVRMYFLSFDPDHSNLVVDFHVQTWKCLIKQVFVWKKGGRCVTRRAVHHVEVVPIGWLDHAGY